MATWSALIIVAMTIGVILCWPTPVDRPIDEQLIRILFALHRMGVPKWVNYAFVETAANVLVFVPLGALIAAVLPRRKWWISGVVCLALSGCMELIQAVLLPNRHASIRDVVANTVGALIGATIVVFIRTVRKHESDS